MFNNYLDSLFKNKVLYRSQQQFGSDHHKVYTEEVNKMKCCWKINRSEIDDYSSILKNHSKMLKSNIGKHRDNIFQLKNKLSMPRYIFKEIVKRWGVSTSIYHIPFYS